MRILVATLSLVLLTGVANTDAQEVKRKTDEFTGVTTTTVTSGPIRSNGHTLTLLLAYVEDNENPNILMLRSGEDWIFAEKLILLVDGDRMTFELCAPGDRSVSGGNVYEWVICHMTYEQLDSLATAEKVKARVSGTRGNADFTLPKKWITMIAAFNREIT